MKKLLAIILAIAMVMSMAIVVSANAPEGYELGTVTKANFGTSGWESSYDSATGVITFNGAWKGRGWWIGETSPMTGYDSMVINFPSAEIAAQVVVQYVSGPDVSTAINKNATSVEVTLDPTVGITQIYIQSKEEGSLTLGDVYMHTAPVSTTPYITGVSFSADPEITMLYTTVAIPNDITFDNYFMLKWYSGNELLTRSIRNINRTQAFDDGDVVGAPTLIYGNYNDEAVDGWCYDSWTADVNKCPTKVELWINGSLVDTYNFDDHADEQGVKDVRAAWNSTYITGDAFEGNMPAEVDAGNANVSTGYFATGDETHAIIVNGAIITSNHVYNANGDCVYCGYHKDVVEDEVVIETPVESDTEEVDEDSTDDVEVDDKTEDTNPTTGVALTIVPMAMAAVAVVASKRR